MGGAVKTPDQRTYQCSVVAAINAELGGRLWARAELARRSGIADQTLYRIWSGERDMSVEMLNLIAVTLGVDVAHLATEAKRWNTTLNLQGSGV